MTKVSRRKILAMTAGVAVGSALAAHAGAAEAWTEGKHYFRIPRPVPPRPGAITVTEVTPLAIGAPLTGSISWE